MKHLTTLATISVLAVSSWATTATAALPSPVAMPLSLQAGASCPTPAPANAKREWKHGQPEYKDFTAAVDAKNSNAQKAQLAAEFVQKFPDSDYKNQALQVEMAAQAAVPGQQQQAVETAQALIKSPGADASQLLAAYVVTAYLDPSLVKPNDPQMQAKMAQLLEAANCGQQLLSSAPEAQQRQYGPVLTKALGFAQLNQKNYDAAIATLGKAAQQNPKDPLPYYWMGVAEVTKATPDYNNGIFDLAKASTLAPQTAAFKSYLETVYTSYHGSADGLQDVITTAQSNTAPPAGFKILSKVDVENARNMAEYQAKLNALKNQLPPANSFAGITARLQKPDMYAQEWKQVKGQGYELEGVVKAITDKSVEIAVGAQAGQDKPADLRVDLAAPLKKRPKVGDVVTVKGVVRSFQPNPPSSSANFMLTMNEGSIAGFSPTAAAAPAAQQ